MKNADKWRMTKYKTERRRRVLKVAIDTQTHIETQTQTGVYYDKAATARKFPKMVQTVPYTIKF